MWFEERRQERLEKEEGAPSLSFSFNQISLQSTQTHSNQVSHRTRWMDEQELYERLKVSLNQIKLIL